MASHEDVSNRKALRAVSRMHTSHVGASQRNVYPYNAGSAGVVERTWPTCKWGVGFLLTQFGKRPQGGRSAFY